MSTHSGSWAIIFLQCAMVTAPPRTAFQPRRPPGASLIRDLLEPIGDFIGMLRAHGSKDAEDHEVESALQNFEGNSLHVASKGTWFQLGCQVEPEGEIQMRTILSKRSSEGSLVAAHSHGHRRFDRTRGIVFWVSGLRLDDRQSGSNPKTGVMSGLATIRPQPQFWSLCLDERIALLATVLSLTGDREVLDLIRAGVRQVSILRPGEGFITRPEWPGSDRAVRRARRVSGKPARRPARESRPLR
jgi:hypothetical protein